MSNLANSASAQNRSFVKQSKARNIEANRSFPGFVNRAFVKESLSRSKTSGCSTSFADTKDTFPVVLPVATQSSTSSEHDDQSSQASEPSSFWNEWADDMAQRDSETDQPLQQNRFIGTLETSVYDDPSFAVLDESVDTAVTESNVPSSNDLDAAKETRETVEGDDDESEDQSMLYPMHTSINTYAVMNISQATVNVTTLNKTETRETVEGDDDESEDESMFYPMHTSINTYAVMNISQATVNVTSLNKTVNEGEVSFVFQAIEFANAATTLLQSKNYGEALEMFHKAADCYAQEKDTSILAAVNAASCYRNMSTVSRLLERYEEGAEYLRKAEELYVVGREGVDVKSSQAILTMDGKRLDDDEQSSPPLNNDASLVSCYTAEEESMCLDAMMLDTLQCRASFHVKYQDDSEQAVECYEQCLKLLIHLNQLGRWDDDPDELPVREQGVTFVQLSKAKHTQVLIKALESLGGLYRTLARDSTYTACLSVYEDALDILQNRQEKEEPNDDVLIFSVSQILRYLSEVYFGRQELDRAVDALHDSMAVKLAASGEPCREALEVMDKMGAANEKMENWEKALSCYEQTLFARCKFYGNTHINVAKSLVNVARVMERKDGSTEESVDLYKAANAIFALQVTSEGPDLGDDVEAILQLIPTVIRQGRYEKAVADLNRCLAMAEDKSKTGVTLDKAQIYFDLGRAYMGMKNHKMATEALMSAIKEVGDVNEEAVFSLVQRVEFLQQADQSKTAAAERSGVLVDPTVSFHDITFQLQNEPSVYIFEDEASAGGNVKGAQSTAVEQRESNPNYDILYQSFSRDHKATDNRFPFDNAIRAHLCTPKAGAPGVGGNTTPNSPLYAKISSQVTKIVNRLKELKHAKEPGTATSSFSSKYKLTAKKLKLIRAKCFKLCQGLPKVASWEPPRATSRPRTETVVHSLFEVQSSSDSPSGSVNDSGAMKFAMHEVRIEEDYEGFESNLIQSSTVNVDP
jgi:tetratricopeptide (TPR) repeat protein